MVSTMTMIIDIFVLERHPFRRYCHPRHKKLAVRPDAIPDNIFAIPPNHLVSFDPCVD